MKNSHMLTASILVQVAKEGYRPMMYSLCDKHWKAFEKKLRKQKEVVLQSKEDLDDSTDELCIDCLSQEDEQQ